MATGYRSISGVLSSQNFNLILTLPGSSVAANLTVIAVGYYPVLLTTLWTNFIGGRLLAINKTIPTTTPLNSMDLSYVATDGGAALANLSVEASRVLIDCPIFRPLVLPFPTQLEARDPNEDINIILTAPYYSADAAGTPTPTRGGLTVTGRAGGSNIQIKARP